MLMGHETAYSNSATWMGLSRSRGPIILIARSPAASIHARYYGGAWPHAVVRWPDGRVAGQRPHVHHLFHPLDGILKETEQQRFQGLTKAIQDDVGLYGDPAIIFSEGCALDFILAELKKVDLEPNLKKFQAYTTSPAEFQAAL